MNFILFICLSGVYSSDISTLTPSNVEVYMEPLVDEVHKEEIRHDIPHDKNDHHFKEEKNYVFTTQTPSGSQSEISVKATTNVDFSLKNYKINETSGELVEEPPFKKIPKTTEAPNESAFWTMLGKVLNETLPEEEERDQLFKAIPDSDLNGTTSEDTGVKAQDNKLKLMLGISLLTLLLFTILLASSSALLFKLKTTYNKQLERQYPIQPELATLSYFQPVQGVSDSSFSRSAESSNVWAQEPTY